MAPRSDEAEDFFAAVYQTVQEIPYGKVTSYGHIAKLIGRPECPRQVGICLKHLPDESSSPAVLYHSGSVPWQRVVNAKGIISPRGNPSGAANQAAVLRQEGVDVEESNMGELMVDLGTYGWFPSELPGQESA